MRFSPDTVVQVIVPRSCALSSLPPASFSPLMVSIFWRRVFKSASDATVQLKPISRTRQPAVMASKKDFVSITELVFSTRRVVRWDVSGRTKVVIPVCPMTVRLAMVPGRRRVFKIPPCGRSRPVIEVPSKYTCSMFEQPEISTACASDGQFRTSRVRRRSLLPR